MVEQVGFITHDRKEGCSQWGAVHLSKMVLGLIVGLEFGLISGECEEVGLS